MNDFYINRKIDNEFFRMRHHVTEKNNWETERQTVFEKERQKMRERKNMFFT